MQVRKVKIMADLSKLRGQGKNYIPGLQLSHPSRETFMTFSASAPSAVSRTKKNVTSPFLPKLVV